MTAARVSRLTPLYSIGLVLLALVALIFIVAALPVESFETLRLRSLAWWVIPAITLLHVAYLMLSAEVWRRMVAMLASRRPGFVDAYLQMSAVAVGKYIPGKVWGFVARVGQLRRDAVPTHLSIMSSVIEQILVLAGGGLVVVAAAFIVFPGYRLYIALLGILVIAGVVVVSWNIPAVTRWLRRDDGDAELPASAGFRPARLLQFSVAYAALWLISGFILGLIYFSLFDAVASARTFAAIVLANTTGFVVGFLAVFAPGGLGVREAATVAVLAPFLPVREVLIAAIALRAWIVLFDGINAVLLLVGETRRAARTPS